MWMNSKINLDHDYATGIVNDRRKYTEAQRALKDLDLKFHSLYQARMKVFTSMDPGSVEEAMWDKVAHGLSITMIE